MPAWANYEVIEKDNPSDYYLAFSQMVYAMRYLRGEVEDFAVETYEADAIEPWKDTIEEIIYIFREAAK